MTVATAARADTATAALPTFLIVGATKCGTTSLHDWLGRHPRAYMHPDKEMRFFLDEGAWSKGLDWYATQFADRGEARAWGEASNGYARSGEYRGAPARIAEFLPAVPLVYVVRDPMKRLVSHWRHRLATGREWRSIGAAVRADPAYVETGLYGAELERWFGAVDPARMLILQSEALFADPRPHLDRLCRHLGIDPAPDLPFRAENVSAERRAVPRLLRQASAVPGLRPLVRRLGTAWTGESRGQALSAFDTHLPATLDAEIRARFAADRPKLEALAGPDITRGWT